MKEEGWGLGVEGAATLPGDGAAAAAAVSSMTLQIHGWRPICCDKSPQRDRVCCFLIVRRSGAIKGCLYYGSDADIVFARRRDLREIPTLSMGMVLEDVVVVAYK